MCHMFEQVIQELLTQSDIWQPKLFLDILCCAVTCYLPLAMRLVCLTGSRERIFHRAGDELWRCLCIHLHTDEAGAEMGGDSLRSANHGARKMTKGIAQSSLPLGDALSRSHSCSCFRTWEMEPLRDFIALRHISLFVLVGLCYVNVVMCFELASQTPHIRVSPPPITQIARKTNMQAETQYVHLQTHTGSRCCGAYFTVLVYSIAS